MSSNDNGGNRFATITPEDHSAWIWLAVLLSLCYSLCFLGFRVIMKIHRYALDDLLLGLAYLFAIGHWVTIFVSLSHQLGKSLNLTTKEQLLDASKALLAGRVLLVPILALAKISVVALIRQIFTVDMRAAWVTCNTFIIMLAGWGLMSIIALSAGCPAAATIDLSDGLCRNESFRWHLVLILDALTEFGPLIIICWFLKPLNIGRRVKMIVAIAFATRIPVAAVSLTFLHFTVKFLHENQADWPLAITEPVVWQEILVGCSLISATLPCLRPFVRRFYTGGLVFVTGLGKLSEVTESGRSTG